MSVGELRASIADVPDDYEVVLDNAEVDDCEISAVRVVAERYAGKALEHHARTEAAEAALAGLVAAVEAVAEASLRDGRGGTWVHDEWFRALIDADHAAALRACEAKALREAADDLLQVGLPSPSRREVHVWLRDRADSIEQARP